MTTPTGRQWPPPSAAVGIALTASAIGIVSVSAVIVVGLNQPNLLPLIAVIVLVIAGIRWLRHHDPRSRPPGEHHPVPAQELVTYDEGRWAQEQPTPAAAQSPANRPVTRAFVARLNRSNPNPIEGVQQ